MTIYEDLVIPIYEATYALLLADPTMDDGIEIVGDVVDQQPKFLKKTFIQLNELMLNIIKLPAVSEESKRKATEALISYAERFPSFYRKHQDKLVSLIEMIFIHMIQISQNVSEEWKNPPEGYNEDNEEEGDL